MDIPPNQDTWLVFRRNKPDVLCRPQILLLHCGWKFCEEMSVNVKEVFSKLSARDWTGLSVQAVQFNTNFQ
jgi:hypothetical protein